MRVKDLTYQLYTFAKGGEPVKKTVPLNNLIQESTNLILSGTSVHCCPSLPGNLYLVDIDEGLITQVLYNIIINAVQAMPDGGTIRLKGENITVNEQEYEDIPLTAGRYVKISIEDEGTGIPENILHKIFDPFFTTKREGKGLGLAASYSIICNHGGYIKAESALGRGTVFTVYLPASDKSAISNKEEKELCYASGKILVMDDDAEIRNILGYMLSHLGYLVQFAEDGNEAIEKYREAKKNNHPFDLVLLDLTIPGGMGGRKTIKELHKEDPEVKAVISSGYSEGKTIANYEKYGFKGVVKKPYTINELSQVVKSVIKNC